MPGEAGMPCSFTSRERVTLEDAIRQFLSELLFDQFQERVRSALFVVAFSVDYKAGPSRGGKQQHAEDRLAVGDLAGVLAAKLDLACEVRSSPDQSHRRASVESQAIGNRYRSGLHQLSWRLCVLCAKRIQDSSFAQRTRRLAKTLRLFDRLPNSIAIADTLRDHLAILIYLNIALAAQQQQVSLVGKVSVPLDHLIVAPSRGILLHLLIRHPVELSAKVDPGFVHGLV